MSVQPLDLSALRASLDAAGHPWHMGQTSMTVLDEDDRRLRLGVPPTPGLAIADLESDVETARLAARLATAEAVGAPSAFDLRNVSGVNYDTAVRDQGGCGSCVAFGTAATIEAVSRYSTRRSTLPVDVSEAHLFYGYGRAAGATCGTGWWPDQAFTAAKDSGVTFEDYFPYTAGDQTNTVNPDWPNHRVKVTAWSYLNGNPAGMKEHISSYGGIAACLDVYQDFFSYRSGVYQHVTGAYAGGHCVALVGYDDALGCWIAKNSWGPGWGDSGYVKIAYGQCRIETYQVIGITGVHFRTWWPNQPITGLWSNEVDGNLWAHAATRGWLRLDGGAPVTALGMGHSLAAAKAAARPVGLFEHGSAITQFYAW